MGRIDTIDRRADVLFILFEYAGTVEGVTKLQKLLFLIEQETEFYQEYGNDVEFEFAPYRMGPFSKHVYEEIEFLMALDALEQSNLEYTPPTPDSMDVEGKAYSLTEKGSKIATQVVRQLEEPYCAEIEELIAEYNGYPLRELLQYVYQTYPEYATQSEIIDTVGINPGPSDDE